MRHDVVLTGYRFRLRPVRRDDAAFILTLRTHERLGRYLHATSSDVSVQERWLDSYFERPDDYYFIVEDTSSGEAEGTLALYDIDSSRKTAEWGRWILRERSAAAPESVLMLYRVAMQKLILDSVFCRTVAKNEKVVSFHESTGLERVRTLHDHFTIGDSQLDAIEQRLTRELWPEVESRLDRICSRLARVAPGKPLKEAT